MKIKYPKYRITPSVLRRLAIVTLVYAMFMLVVWSAIGQTFPDGIEPPWLLWLIIGLSILVYVAFVLIVEISNWKKVL